MRTQLVRVLPSLVGVLGALCVSAALALGMAMPATASAGSLVSIVNANAPTKAAGGQFDAVQLSAPAACDARATRHVAYIIAVRPAKPSDQAAAKMWVGDNLYATSSVGLPGPLTVRSNGSWQQLADAFGQKIVPGRYSIELRCQDNLATAIYQRWRGDVTFTSSTSWKGHVVTRQATAAPTRSAGSAAPSGAAPSAASVVPSGAAPSSDKPPASGAATPGAVASDSLRSAATDSPLAAGNEAEQPPRGADPSLRKDLVIGAGLALVGAVLLLRVWRRRPPTGRPMEPR